MDSPSPGSEAHRKRTAEQQELEERRLACVTAFQLGVGVWLLFFALDVYVVGLLHHGSIAWFLTWRLVGVPPLVALIFYLRSSRRSSRGVTAGEVAGFGLVGTICSLMSLRHGGLNSHYLYGICYVILYQATAIPDRWNRSLLVALSTSISFPLVMALAAIWDPSVRSAWVQPDTRWLFFHDYTFVLASAGIASINSHFTWRTRRQVFEARRLGSYRLKARIGAGGMGEVWLARHEKEGRDVALKILDVTQSLGKTSVARFEREARAAARLRSNNTIRVFDFGASDDGVWYIAMELLDGIDLAALVRDFGPQPPARVIHFLRQVCDSLAEAHTQGIIHRDIKPANLFLLRQPADQIKLLDFGIAKVTTDESRTLTQAGSLAGTPEYMAPEAHAGQAGTMSDLYSLGAVAYFLLTGTPPFRGENVIEILLAHREQSPEPPSARLGRALPTDLEAIVLRCLSKDPTDRFVEASDLDAALARCRDADAWQVADRVAFWQGESRPVLRKRQA